MKKDGSAKRNLPFLQLLGISNIKRRNMLIEMANKGEIYSICECIDNVLNGNVSLDPKTMRSLSNYKKQLRLLKKRNNSLKTRKSILQKYGKFLSLIIPSAISILKQAFNI